MDHPFRTALMGGFNRQDVLDYLEQTAAASARERQAIQNRLEEREHDCRRLSAQAAEAETLRRERDLLEEELAGVRRTLADCQARLQEQEREAAALRQETAALRARVEALEPEASAYAAVKDRTAGVELEAHRRAREILDQGEEQAGALRQRVERWMCRVEEEYGGLCAELEAAADQASGQLKKSQQCLDELRTLFSDQKIALNALSQTYTGIEEFK